MSKQPDNRDFVGEVIAEDNEARKVRTIGEQVKRAPRVSDDPAVRLAECRGEAADKYGEVLKPFLSLMEKELIANAYKGDRPGWLEMTPGECLLEIYYHTGKLHKAVHGGESEQIAEYAADVANMAMMLTDICGLLACAKSRAGVA